MFDNLKIYMMDLADVFILLFESEYVQTHYKQMIRMIWGIEKGQNTVEHEKEKEKEKE